MSEIYIGKKFSSYDEFQHQLQKFSAQSSSVFWKRDSRHIDSVKGKVKKAEMANPKLRYYFVRVCCVRGGRAFKKKKNSTGQRLRTTKREDCPAFISLSISSDGQYLEISAMNLNHTHDNTIVENKRRRRKPKPVQEIDLEKQNTLEINNEAISNDDNLYLKHCNENFETSETVTPVNTNNSIVRSKKEPLSLHQRYLEVSHLTAELTVLISELPAYRFRRRISQIEDLIRFWKSGREVSISPIEKFSKSDSSSHPAASQQLEIESEEYLPTSTSTSNELDQLYHVQSSNNVVYVVVDSPNDINPTNVLEIEEAIKNTYQISSHNTEEVIQHEAHSLKADAEEYLLPTTCSSNISSQSYIYGLEKELKGEVQISNENSAESSQPGVALDYYEVTINDCDEITKADSSTNINSPNGPKKMLLEVSPSSKISNENPVIHQFSKKRRLDNELDSIRISLLKKNS